MSILNALSEIILHRGIILSPVHNDALFFGALTHHLFMLSVTPDILPKKEGSSNLDRGSAQVRFFEGVFILKNSLAFCFISVYISVFFKSLYSRLPYVLRRCGTRFAQ